MILPFRLAGCCRWSPLWLLRVELGVLHVAGEHGEVLLEDSAVVVVRLVAFALGDVRQLIESSLVAVAEKYLTLFQFWVITTDRFDGSYRGKPHAYLL